MAGSDTPLMAQIKGQAKNITSEIGVDWDDLPASIAENAMVELMVAVREMPNGPQTTMMEIVEALGIEDVFDQDVAEGYQGADHD